MKHKIIVEIFKVALIANFLKCPDAQAQVTLRIASDDWCPFICTKNGEVTGGYLVDVSKQAMLLSGYQVDPVLMPLSRAIHETTSDHIQGVYAPPIDDRFVLTAPISYSRACFYTRSYNTWTYTGMDSLHNVVVGIVSDYGYDGNVMDAYINKNQHDPSSLDMAFGDNAGLSNLKKLLAARFPVILEHDSVMAFLVRQTDAGDKIRLAGCLEHAMPLSIGFSKTNQHSVELIKALATGLKRLDQSGKLSELRRQYQIFDAAADKSK